MHRSCRLGVSCKTLCWGLLAIAPLCGASHRARTSDQFETKDQLSGTPDEGYRIYREELAAQAGPVERCSPLDRERCKGNLLVPPIPFEEIAEGEDFIPESQVQHGPAQLKKWLAKAKSGVLYCEEDECLFYAFGVVPPAWRGYRLLVQCWIERSTSTDGAPTECKWVGAIGDVNYVSANTCPESKCAHGGTPSIGLHP